MLTVLYKLRWFFKMYWKRYTIAVGCLAIGGVLEMIPPKLIGVAIDAIHQNQLTAAYLVQLLLFFVGLIIVIYLINYVWFYQLFGGSFLVEKILRSRFMKHLLKMTPTFYERNRTGGLMARATNDLGAISNTAGFGILTLIDSSVFFLVVLLTMGFLISWPLTLAALLPLPILAYAMKKFGAMIHDRFMVAQNTFGDLNDQVLENISGIRVIRAYVQESANHLRFHNVTEDVYNKNIAVARIDALFEPTIKIIVGMSYLIGLSLGSYFVFQSKITLGDLVAFNVYLGMLIWPMFAIGELINLMQRGNASLDRVNETLAYRPDVQDSSHPVGLTNPGTIKFDYVTFRYPTSREDNLMDMNFTLRKGETLGIVGRTGSGKTTLLKQLLRQYPQGQGRITMDDIPIEEIELDQLKRWIGYVPQEQILFSRTIRENIMFGAKESSEVLLQRMIDLAALRQDIETFPNGLNTLVGENGVALSGGQKQRVSIARALILNPEILLLDDAMSAVDAKTEAKIIHNIRHERIGKTTFIATHRLSVVMHADHIIVIEEGRIVERGTHEELLKQNGWYKEQYEHQQVQAKLR